MATLGIDRNVLPEDTAFPLLSLPGAVRLMVLSSATTLHTPACFDGTTQRTQNADDADADREGRQATGVLHALRLACRVLRHDADAAVTRVTWPLEELQMALRNWTGVRIRDTAAPFQDTAASTSQDWAVPMHEMTDCDNVAHGGSRWDNGQWFSVT